MKRKRPKRRKRAQVPDKPKQSFTLRIALAGIALASSAAILSLLFSGQPNAWNTESDDIAQEQALEQNRNPQSVSRELDPPDHSVAKGPGANDRLANAAPQSFTLRDEIDQPRIRHWFGGVPEVIWASRIEAPTQSNIRRDDYVGSDACKKCHADNHKDWSAHPHRWMNAEAKQETIKGDFSGKNPIDYMGGVGTFYQQDGQYLMGLERDGIRRTFAISRTIGSRFTQYYIATMIDGPEPASHTLRHLEHVMPFGYWFEPRQWVPIVNVQEESPDEERNDPFEDPSAYPYDRSCSICHTTRPTGDSMLWADTMRRFDAYGPRVINFFAESYLQEEHPNLVASLAGHSSLSRNQMSQTLTRAMGLSAKDHASELGISCEACHNGCAEHVQNEEQLPTFFPASAEVFVEGEDASHVWGRNSHNVNWVCSRCHAGGRKRYASGISTWNSTEYSDATRGSCYDANTANQHGMEQLTCIRCHNPHQATGQQWSRTPEQDNESCVSCHEQFQTDETLAAHTHHAVGSTGSECMNCHMPRVNEGLQDVVRTHTIFSPTEPRMIEANQPNACNICHVEKPIDWTLTHLKDWYGADGYSQSELSANYPHRDGPVAAGWLESSHHATRLIGADALARAGANWAMNDLVDMLDDPYLINRQFTARGLDRMLEIDLRDHGYQFFMFSKERAGPIAKIRELLMKKSK